MTDRETRTITIEREIAVPPEEVWEALTTGEGLRQWFPLDARVEPGLGGSVWLSWGPGSEGEAPITLWEPPGRFQWTESYGDDDQGRPIKVAVDFHVEGREGTTVVRLVQSGLSASAEWDEMYDALHDGWSYFMLNLAYYFLKHRGQKRQLVWKRVATDLARDAVWERLIASALIGVSGSMSAGDGVTLEIGQSLSAEVASAREGFHFTATIPELDDSLFFIEIEGSHVGFWLSTYGMDDERVEKLQAALDDKTAAALG